MTLDEVVHLSQLLHLPSQRKIGSSHLCFLTLTIVQSQHPNRNFVWSVSSGIGSLPIDAPSVKAASEGLRVMAITATKFV